METKKLYAIWAKYPDGTVEQEHPETAQSEAEAKANAQSRKASWPEKNRPTIVRVELVPDIRL